MAKLNESYATGAPSPQTAIDIFKEEWSSKFPVPFDGLKAGQITLFEDDRINWFLAEIGGATNKKVLELGPLEAGHTYMLHKAGAQSVISVEANTRAYLKCLIAKEILGIANAQFLCGDFLDYLRAPDCPRFEVCLACGVLYHMRNPAELVSLLAKHCTRHLLFWGHYYDAALLTRNGLIGKFTKKTHTVEFEGFTQTLHRYEYKAAVRWGGFCGGTTSHTNWMSRADLLGCLEHFGFGDFRINFDQPDHPNGPALALVATKK